MRHICDRLVRTREHLMGCTVLCACGSKPPLAQILFEANCILLLILLVFWLLVTFLILTLKILYVRRWNVLAICEDSQYYIGG